MRVVLRLAVGLLALAVGTLGFASRSAAHAVLIDTEPKAGAIHTETPQRHKKTIK